MTTRATSDPVGPYTTDLPDVPSVELSIPGSETITATWDAVSNNGVYRLQIREMGEETWDSSADGFSQTTVGNNTDEYDFTELEHVTSYEVRVRSETDDVDGAWTDPAFETTTDEDGTRVLRSEEVQVTTELPEPSFDLDGTDPTELDVLLNDEISNGEYVIEFRDDDRDGFHPDWEHEATVPHDGDLTHTIENVLDGEQYSVRVKSETEYVTTGWVTAEELTKLFAATDATAVSVGEKTATVEWTDNSDFRGSYQIWLARTDFEYGDEPGHLVKTAEDDAESATVDGLQPGREYEITVRARTQWVRADSDAATVQTEGIGLEARAISPTGPYVEIDHPAGSAPLKPEISTIQRQPTVNGYPRLSVTVPSDERWVNDDRLDDAEIRAWIDGERQPVDRLEHRSYSPQGVTLEARGATQLDRRVVENVDIIEALKFAKWLIEEYTDYDVVLDVPDDIVREDVLLQFAQTLAELQAAFEEIPTDIPLEWNDDRLVPLQVAWTSNGPDVDLLNSEGTETDDAFIAGEAAIMQDIGAQATMEFNLEYEVQLSDLVVGVRGDDRDTDDMVYEVNIAGENITDSGLFPDDNEWSTWSLNDDTTIGPGTYEAQFDIVDGSGSPGFMFDAMTVFDSRYADLVEDEEVHEPGGHLEHPPKYPDRDTPVRLAHEEIATPLSIVRLLLKVVTDDGEGLPELAIGEDGTDEWDTVTRVVTHELEYEELSATALARVGLGYRDDLEPRDATPRIAYEPQALESVELRADLDETPVLVNYAPDKRLMDALREIMDIADAVFAAVPGDDGTEIHISRIDGRPSDVDPNLIDFSVERNTEDSVDRAIVYAGAESIRRLPFQADVDEWADLPLGDGRIVRGSETVFDATDDEESLERGEDYEIIPNNPDGPPQIKLVTSLQEPRIDCDFKPRGEHEAADLPDEPSVIIEDAPNLASQQMADIAAFQAVEGSYTDAIIDASISVPVDQIGWNVLDALNVAELPGDQPYQIKDGDSDPASGDYRLGAGRTGQEEIQQLNDETGRLSERV